MMNVTAAGHSMVIRSATEKDLDRVLEIDQLSFPTPWTHHCFKITLKDIFFVIERKEIMGYLVACLCDLGLRAEVLRIAVHPDHRRNGIAKELIETMLQLLSKENADFSRWAFRQVKDLERLIKEIESNDLSME
jgi:ribosomal-protein-alanine N-acetyltransferase